MSFGNTAENNMMAYIFNTTAPSWAGNSDFYLALHTSDPGEAGNQTTNEVAYTSYARIPIARSSGGFTVSGNQATNTALVQFPLCTGSSATATHFSIGTASTSTGQIIMKGPLDSSLPISTGIQPQFPAGDLVASLD